jgi:flavin-dependent dehydrogenase
VKNVKGLTNSIEMHFVENVCPGYFWIFPVSEDTANVGMGIRLDRLKKKNKSIRDLHLEILQSKNFQSRFSEADFSDEIKGGNLPLAHKNRKFYHKNIAFLGDAAGLIDPFSGEGIGNAMLSAKILIESIAVDLANDVAIDLQVYHTNIWKRLELEISITYKIQKLFIFKFLINFITKKCAKANIQLYIRDIVSGKISKKEFLNPIFYLRLLFA